MSSVPSGAIVLRCQRPVRTYHWLRGGFGFQKAGAKPADDVEVSRELRGMGMRIILPPAPRGERKGSRVADRENDDWLASHTGISFTPRVEVAELEEAYRRVVMLHSAIVYPLTEGPQVDGGSFAATQKGTLGKWWMGVPHRARPTRRKRGS